MPTPLPALHYGNCKFCGRFANGFFAVVTCNACYAKADAKVAALFTCPMKTVPCDECKEGKVQHSGYCPCGCEDTESDCESCKATGEVVTEDCDSAVCAGRCPFNDMRAAFLNAEAL